MTDHDRRLSRRALLGAAVAVVAGCTTTRHPTAPDADAATVAAARDSELKLLASSVAGTPKHTAHLAHVRALGGDLPSSPAAPSTTPTLGAADETASVPVLQAAARSVRNGTTAAVLASIAASHAVLGREKR